MHREYHPDDLRHRRAHAFDAAEGHNDGHDHHDHRSLFAFTALLGALIAADLVLAAAAPPSWRAPFGLSPIWIAAILGAARIVYGALEALFAGRIGADFALAQACVAALVLREPFVAAEVVFIAMVGEVLEAVTADRAMRAIGRLFEQSPRTARVRRDGVEVEVPIGQVAAGEIVVVGAGERIPVDGPVVSGRSTVDQSALTGESIPVDKGPGDPAFTGTLNLFGALEVRAERIGHDSTFGQVLRLVAEAQVRKAPIERLADRLARLFLPAVQIVAGLTLLAGYWLGWPDVWERTVAVLVVACPCALVLATPAAVLASMAWLARHGIVIKGGVALERLAACDVAAFDKTGTLTLGRPELASVVPLGEQSDSDVLRWAASAEKASRHPLAAAVVRGAAERGLDTPEADEVTALPGVGVAARVRRGSEAERQVLVGNRRLMNERGTLLGEETTAALDALESRGETPLIVAIDGEVAGLIGVRDAVRPEAHDVIHDLKHRKIREIALLTGDRPGAAKAVARRVHIKVVESELLPADKARWIAERQQAGRKVMMVGDGINDAPALAQADVGIAIGGPGADLAAEAGDIVVLGDPLRNLPELVRLSRATVGVIRQNIVVFAFGLNAVAMASASLGILGPVAAAILHQAGSLLVLLNAMRLLVFGDWHRLAPFRWLAGLRDAIRGLDDRLDPAPVIASLARRWRWVAALVALVCAVGYATSGWVAIGPGEVGLLRSQGRFAGVLGPGLHLRWPAPFERVTRIAPGRLRGVSIGFRAGDGPSDKGAVRWESSHGRSVVARDEDEALVVTGDGQLVELTSVAQYTIRDGVESLRRYAFEAAEPDTALRPLAEAAVRSVVGRLSLDRLLTSGRGRAETDARADLQRRADACGLGVEIRSLAFQEIHPPLAVVDAYRDVSRAQGERQTRINQALAYRAERLGQSAGQAIATREAAEATKSSRVARAGGEADAFLSRLESRSDAPGLADHRRYWRAIETTLTGKPKLILDPAHAGGRRHLYFSDLATPFVGPPPAASTDPRGDETPRPRTGPDIEKR